MQTFEVISGKGIVGIHKDEIFTFRFYGAKIALRGDVLVSTGKEVEVGQLVCVCLSE